MNCPNCQAALPDDAVFCGHCGKSLQVTCARCGRANPVGMRFCLGCGQPVSPAAVASVREPRSYTPKHLAEKILTSRSALEGERKQVTVLFADLVNYTTLSAQLGEEALFALMDELYER